MGGTVTKCWMSQPPYARYHSNSKVENEVDLENVLGSLLEMDPSLQDREEGVGKINSWIEEISSEIQMSGPQLEISRWKCIKYWEAQHVSDIYGNGKEAVKLTGSCVRFYFENSHKEDVLPRLVIEHCGKTLQIKSRRHSKSKSSKAVPIWMKNIRELKWNPFHGVVRRRNDHGASFISNNDTTEMLTTRYG
uniref:Uncharacterized protein n=1 Tax=Clytia hemisphaerica TaxID=252671 RepID=A0A7M5XII1_9CNID